MRMILWLVIAMVLTQGYAIQAMPESNPQAPIEDVF